MKVKVLTSEYYDKSGYKVLRVYLEPDFEFAKKDLLLLSDQVDKECKLHDCELFNELNYAAKI